MLAIADAIRFHTMVGGERKEARLRYLQQYWTDRVRGIPKVYLNTPTGDRACGIANVGITGHDAGRAGRRAVRQVQDLHGGHRHGRR